MRRKFFIFIITSSLICSLALSGCNKSSNSVTNETSAESTEYNADSNVAENATVEKFDITSSYNEEETTDIVSVKEVFDEDGTLTLGVSNGTSDKNVILLNDSSISVKGNGMEVNDTKVTISKAGTYYVTGILSEGQIVINCEEEGTVRLVLNGITMTCSNSAPIYCKQADLFIVNLVDGTTNTLTDKSTYVFEDGTDEPNACLYCDDDMTINGTGTLIVNGNYNNGIVAKDILKIYNGSITVSAANNGIKGKDGIIVTNGKINIKCDGDGLKSDNTSNSEKGYILIEGSSLVINSGEDGVQAETCLKITGGNINITTGEGSKAVSTGNNWGTKEPWGNNTSTSTETVSMKGLKAGTDITITDGTMVIDSEDDSIHTNATITITGGNLLLASGDDGIHSDTELTISGGTIDVTQSYEGLESATINIKGGNISVIASDDGLNAAGGDGSSTNERPGMNGFSSSTGTINISGGYIKVSADGDGIDSNGDINMSGGEVYVEGPTNDGNGYLDYDGAFSQIGGILWGSGSAGMLQYPSCSDKAYGVTVVLDSSQNANTTVKICDSNGNTVIEYTPKKNFIAFTYAGTNLKKGETYTIFVNGTEQKTFTVSSSDTTVGNIAFGGGGTQPGNTPPNGRDFQNERDFQKEKNFQK